MRESHAKRDALVVTMGFDTTMSSFRRERRHGPLSFWIEFMLIGTRLKHCGFSALCSGWKHPDYSRGHPSRAHGMFLASCFRPGRGRPPREIPK